MSIAGACARTSHCSFFTPTYPDKSGLPLFFVHLTCLFSSLALHPLHFVQSIDLSLMCVMSSRQVVMSSQFKVHVRRPAIAHKQCASGTTSTLALVSVEQRYIDIRIKHVLSSQESNGNTLGGPHDRLPNQGLAQPPQPFAAGSLTISHRRSNGTTRACDRRRRAHYSSRSDQRQLRFNRYLDTLDRFRAQVHRRAETDSGHIRPIIGFRETY